MPSWVRWVESKILSPGWWRREAVADRNSPPDKGFMMTKLLNTPVEKHIKLGSGSADPKGSKNS